MADGESSGGSKKPMCVIVTGRPGSGKTTFSKRLAKQLWLPTISRDEIKEGYVNTHGVKHDQLPPDSNRLVSNLFLELVCHCLAGRVSVIIEAAFQHKVWASMMPRIRELAVPLFVVCDIDATVAAKRHLQRGMDAPRREFFHGDRRVTTFRETGQFLPPGEYLEPDFDVPTLHVSTEGEYSPTVDVVAEWILGARDL